MDDDIRSTDLTATRPSPLSQEFRPRFEAEAISAELAKMLGLVAPVTMTADQQALWITSGVDALQGIRADEVAHVSAEVRRTVTRPSQIVPEIAKLVASKRARHSSRIEVPMIQGPPPKKSVMDRRGQPMSEADTAELNVLLEHLGANARYRPDGSRYLIDGSMNHENRRG